MKYLIIIIISLLSLNVSNAQSKSDLKKEVSSLKMEIQKLNLYIEDLESQIEVLQSNKDSSIEESSPDTIAVKLYQCKAITNAGKRCSRTAKPGTDYCWQHQQKSKVQESTSSSSTGRKIYTGPRGGKYYINSNGKKVYLKRK